MKSLTDPIRPRLRAVLATPAGDDGDLVEFLDPLGIATESRVGIRVPAHVYAIARLFDGQRSCAEIAAALSRESATSVSVAQVESVADGFSRRHLLDDDSFWTRRDAEHRAFKSSPERPFVGAGRDYEADPIDLRIKIAGLVANDWDMPPPEDPFGVITPATDITRAAALYARTYAALRHSGARFERALLLGALGAPLERLLVPLDRDFGTPFGPLPCDAKALAALGIEAGALELAHRGTLVLERQTLFLKLLFPRLPIVPILVSEPDPTANGDAGASEEDIERALEALARVMSLPGRTLVVCASDLTAARRSQLTPDAARRTREADRRAVDAATRIDVEEFHSELSAAGGPRSARSFLAPYLFLRLCAAHARAQGVGPVRGSVLGYAQMNGPHGSTTAASIVFH